MSDQLVASGNEVTIASEMTETDDAHRYVLIDDNQPNANHIVVIGNQQLSTVQVDPLDDNVVQEDATGYIECLDRKISRSESAYSKIIGRIYKFLRFYAIMQAAIPEAVFSPQQSNCKDSWGLLALSAIVSGGVVVALLREFSEQFRLLRRERLLIEKRNSLVDHCLREGIRLSSISRITVSEDDFGINCNYWRWTAERVVFVLTLIAFSVCLWRSCKPRLLC